MYVFSPLSALYSSSLSFPHPLPHSPLQCKSIKKWNIFLVSLVVLSVQRIFFKICCERVSFLEEFHKTKQWLLRIRIFAFASLQLTRIQADVGWEGAHRHTSLMVTKFVQNRPLKNRQEVFQGWKVMCHVWVQSQSWAWGPADETLWNCEDFLL